MPPLKPLPGGTLADAVANGPRLASIMAIVGSGPRWYGLPDVSASAGRTPNVASIVTPAAITAAIAAAASAISRADVPFRRMTDLRQLGMKSWLVAGTFLQDHWSSCWPVLLPAPNTSRHRPLFWFWNCQDPSDCCSGFHRELAAPLRACCTMSGTPAVVELLATATTCPEFWACNSPYPSVPGRYWNCWFACPLQVHWSIAAPVAPLLPNTSR